VTIEARTLHLRLKGMRKAGYDLDIEAAYQFAGRVAAEANRKKSKIRGTK
jgi:hypothetical protein